MYSNIYFTSKISLLGSISKDLFIRMVYYIVDHKKASMFAAGEKIVRQYRIIGYTWADNKFESLREMLFVNRSYFVHLCS